MINKTGTRVVGIVIILLIFGNYILSTYVLGRQYSLDAGTFKGKFRDMVVAFTQVNMFNLESVSESVDADISASDTNLQLSARKRPTNRSDLPLNGAAHPDVNIFITMKTTPSYYEQRIRVSQKTWFQKVNACMVC